MSEEALLRRDWRLFTALTFLFGFGFAIYMGPFQNFIKEALGAKELDLGILESLREVPGLLAALTAGSLIALAQSRVAALGLLITAIGIGVTGFAHNMPVLIALSVFWSVGFHLYATVSGAITMALAKGVEGGRHLGRMAGVGSTATICGYGLTFLAKLAFPNLPYEAIFAVSGLSIAGAAVLAMMLSSHAESHSTMPFVYRREYGLFYLLTFLEGCRRQIFAIFATFALILVYKVPVQHILGLLFINQVLISFTAPAIGRYIDKHGERNTLSFYAVGLILVFIGWATIRRIEVLYVLYIIDNVLFSFNVGFTTYLHRIVRPGEFRPCLAMGVTMNHIAAVTVPIGGALLWKATNNYQLPFIVGVAIALVSLSVTRRLPVGAVARE